MQWRQSEIRWQKQVFVNKLWLSELFIWRLFQHSSLHEQLDDPINILSDIIGHLTQNGTYL